MILQNKLLALLNEVLNQTAKLRKGGNEASYFCCFCNHYKRKLEFNLENGAWSCWVCHARGSYIGSFLTKIKAPKRYRDLAFELTKDVRLQRRRCAHVRIENEAVLPDDFLSLADPRPSQEYRHALTYLKKRRIGFDDICRYNIGYCEAGEYKDCVVVPSYDSEGRLNYFSARYIYPSEWLKYKNAPFSKDIIGFECFVDFSQPVTLVEGVFDAIATRVNAVPLFGTRLNNRLKAALIINKTPWVNLLLDNDALREAIAATQDLWRWGVPVHLVKLEDKDPSKIGFGTVHDLIQQSRPYGFEDLVFDKLKEQWFLKN